MTKHPKPERHKKKAAKHTQQSGQQKGICEMSATPSGKPPSNPTRTRKDTEYSPTPGEMMRRFIIWLRGFHLHREKSKVTDWFVVALTLGVAIAAFYSAWIFQRQLEEARKSTRLSVRPWIGLDEGVDAITTSPLKIDAEGNASIVYNIRTKNYGSVPATNVSASARLVVADDLHTVWKEQDIACSDAMIGKPEIGLLLFQGRNRAFDAMPSFANVSQKHTGGQIQAWLAGCIGYRDQFNYLCRTKFIWMMYDISGYVTRIDSYKWPAMVNGQFRDTGGGIDTCQIPKYNYGEGIYKDMPKNPN